MINRLFTSISEHIIDEVRLFTSRVDSVYWTIVCVAQAILAFLGAESPKHASDLASGMKCVRSRLTQMRLRPSADERLTPT
jgi:hypothetical protein